LFLFLQPIFSRFQNGGVTPPCLMPASFHLHRPCPAFSQSTNPILQPSTAFYHRNPCPPASLSKNQAHKYGKMKKKMKKKRKEKKRKPTETHLNAVLTLESQSEKKAITQSRSGGNMYTQQHEQKTGMIYRLPQVDEKRKNRPLKCNMWEIINKQAKSRPTKRTKGNKTFFTQSDPIYKSDPIRQITTPP
jgi:hypothetical protein